MCCTPSLGAAEPDSSILFLRPIPDVSQGEEEEEEDGVGLCLPATLKNCLPHRGISVLEKLIKTCPVWLQLGLGREEAARILHQEVAGVSQGLSVLWSRAGTALQSLACSHVDVDAPATRQLPTYLLSVLVLISFPSSHSSGPVSALKGLVV